MEKPLVKHPIFFPAKGLVKRVVNSKPFNRDSRTTKANPQMQEYPDKYVEEKGAKRGEKEDLH